MVPIDSKITNFAHTIKKLSPPILVNPNFVNVNVFTVGEAKFL